MLDDKIMLAACSVLVVQYEVRVPGAGGSWRSQYAALS